MTLQEIIESINYCLECDNDRIPTTQEDLQIIKKAIEKQISKKPIIDNRNTHYIDYKDYICPCCKKRIITKIDGDFISGRKQKYCDNCGQALDWEDVK